MGRRPLANALDIDLRGGLTSEVTPHAGVALLIELGRRSGVIAAAEQHLPAKKSAKGLRQGEFVEAFVLLSGLGGDCVDDFDGLPRDHGLAALLGYDLPAAATARQCLDRFHDPAAVADRPCQGNSNVVADSAYAGRALLEGRPPTVHVISRLRLDAALWARPTRRRPGQEGRPRRRGHRLPTPKAMALARRRWDPLPLVLYGRQVSPLVFTATALWNGAPRDQPVRIVVVRDPNERRKDEAFFCTDLSVSPAFILESYARRWTLEVSFHDQKQFLGFEDPQNQAAQAVARTAPLAGLVYDLVLLWYAARSQQGAAPGWVARPWHRAKATPSFLDMLTAVRQAPWRRDISAPPYSPRCPHNCTPSRFNPRHAAA